MNQWNGNFFCVKHVAYPTDSGFSLSRTLIEFYFVQDLVLKCEYITDSRLILLTYKKEIRNILDYWMLKNFKARSFL